MNDNGLGDQKVLKRHDGLNHQGLVNTELPVENTDDSQRGGSGGDELLQLGLIIVAVGGRDGLLLVRT